MERIFENLYENVSEACFEDIVSMVEEEIKKYRTGLKDDTIDSLVQKRRKELHDAIGRTDQEKKKAGMQPFTAYPNPPKKVKEAILNQHKAEDKLKKTREKVNKITNK